MFKDASSSERVQICCDSVQAREGDLDKGKVRGEEIPQEAGIHGGPRQRREEDGAALECEEVSPAQQRHHCVQNAAEVPTGARQHVSFHAVCRYVRGWRENSIRTIV